MYVVDREQAQYQAVPFVRGQQLSYPQAINSQATADAAQNLLQQVTMSVVGFVEPHAKHSFVFELSHYSGV
jgi:hypothetical protein